MSLSNNHTLMEHQHYCQVVYDYLHSSLCTMITSEFRSSIHVDHMCIDRIVSVVKREHKAYHDATTAASENAIGSAHSASTTATAPSAPIPVVPASQPLLFDETDVKKVHDSLRKRRRSGLPAELKT